MASQCLVNLGYFVIGAVGKCPSIYSVIFFFQKDKILFFCFLITELYLYPVIFSDFRNKFSFGL